MSRLEWERLVAWVWVDFFQQAGLTTRKLADSPSDIGSDFRVVAGDLNEEGLQLYAAVETNWLAALDRRDFPEKRKFLTEKNTKILERHLQNMRQAAGATAIREEDREKG